MIKIKRITRFFLAVIIIAANLLLTIQPLGAAGPDCGFGSAAIVEQGLNRLAAYDSNSTPEEQVSYLLQQAFVDPVPEEVLNAESIDEMLYLLGDPYTSFMTREQYDSFISPEVTGVGVYIEGVAQGLLVISLIPGSPAEKGGLQAGDIIYQVKEHHEENWISLAGLSVDQGSSLIRGPAGSRVDLAVIREGKLLDFTLTREKLGSTPVVVSLPDPDIALIELNTFLDCEDKPSTAALFAEALQSKEAQDVQGYILDLRDNGGGYVNNALDIASFFIGDKTAMLLKSRAYPEPISQTGRTQEPLTTKPVVVLTNQNTASASEILTGALKDYNRALSLGGTTYGKGCMQKIYPIYYQGSLYGYLKVTTARFYTPLDNVVDRVGLDPDIALYQSDPLLAARLLLSATDSEGSPGVVKLINGSQEYLIDVGRAQEQEYWQAYSEIIDNAGSTYFMLPEHTDWAQAEPGQAEAKWPFYYPGYRQFPSIQKYQGESITVSFSHALDPASIDGQAVELRDKESGENVGLGFKLIKANELQLTPQSPLQPGREYWLAIHSGDRGVCSSERQLPLSTGYIAVVTARGE